MIRRSITTSNDEKEKEKERDSKAKPNAKEKKGKEKDSRAKSNVKYLSLTCRLKSRFSKLTRVTLGPIFGGELD